jgi:hypothetical protein
MLSTPEVLRRTGGKPVKSIVFDEATIAARVEALGAEITEAYPAGDLLVVGLLKGSFIFLARSPAERSGSSTTRKPGWKANISCWSRI